MHKYFHDDNRHDRHVLKTTLPEYLARNNGEIGADDLFAILEACQVATGHDSAARELRQLGRFVEGGGVLTLLHDSGDPTRIADLQALRAFILARDPALDILGGDNDLRPAAG